MITTVRSFFRPSSFKFIIHRPPPERRVKGGIADRRGPVAPPPRGYKSQRRNRSAARRESPFPSSPRVLVASRNRRKHTPDVGRRYIVRNAAGVAPRRGLRLLRPHYPGVDASPPCLRRRGDRDQGRQAPLAEPPVGHAGHRRVLVGEGAAEPLGRGLVGQGAGPSGAGTAAGSVGQPSVVVGRVGPSPRVVRGRRRRGRVVRRVSRGGGRPRRLLRRRLVGPLVVVRPPQHPQVSRRDRRRLRRGAQVLHDGQLQIQA